MPFIPLPDAHYSAPQLSQSPQRKLERVMYIMLRQHDPTELSAPRCRRLECDDSQLQHGLLQRFRNLETPCFQSLTAVPAPRGQTDSFLTPDLPHPISRPSGSHHA